MENDPSSRYVMPQFMGPVDREFPGGIVYKERQVLALQYETAPEAISALLPDCFRPAGTPTVTVAFVYNDGVEAMAGRGYRIATVMVAAEYDGEQDQVEGDYALVMFEDDTVPILLGRELLGVPKLYADISPIRMLPSGHLCCEASLWGHPLFGVDLGPLVKQDESACAAANEVPPTVLLGYKYIPSLDGDPDTAYPLATPREVRTDEMWQGESASLCFGDPTYDDIGFIAGLIDALKRLPVHQVTGVMRSRGSAILRADLSRRLR